MSRAPKLSFRHFLFIVTIVAVTLLCSGVITKNEADRRFNEQRVIVENEFNQFFTTVRAYAKMVVVNQSIKQNRALDILEDPNFPVFQFRLISANGQELIKVDKYGYNNKNDVSSRAYWDEVSKVAPGDWYISPAQENWENDSITGEEIVSSHNTFRFFHRVREPINGEQGSFLAFNVDYSKLAKRYINTTYRLDMLNEVNRTEKAYQFEGFELVSYQIIEIENGSKRFPILILSSSYYLGYAIGGTISTIILLVSLYWNWLRIKQNVNLELYLEQQQNTFTANWINMASHYFRHPVANITSNLELLTLKGIISKDQKEVVKMFASLDEFLSIFSHLQKVNILNNLEHRDMENISIHKLAGLLSSEFDARLEIAVVCDPNIQLQIDRETFLWALSEMVQNSIYHGRAEHISLNINASWNTLQIHMIDDGVGMPQEMIGQLNRKKVELKTNGIQTGKFGLGYYQVFRIMEQHEFEIAIDSSKEQGTSIVIEIPETKFSSPVVDTEA